jgi:hypothetical protein
MNISLINTSLLVLLLSLVVGLQSNGVHGWLVKSNTVGTAASVAVQCTKRSLVVHSCCMRSRTLVVDVRTKCKTIRFCSKRDDDEKDTSTLKERQFVATATDEALRSSSSSSQYSIRQCEYSGMFV